MPTLGCNWHVSGAHDLVGDDSKTVYRPDHAAEAKRPGITIADLIRRIIDQHREGKRP